MNAGRRARRGPPDKDDKRTSEVVSEFARGLTAPKVAFSEIDAALGERGFGVMIAIFALPNAIPGPPLPGLSAVLGLPIVVFAAQLMFGRTKLALPGFIMRRTFDTHAFQRLADKVVRAFRWFEKLLRPRFHLLTGAIAERILGGYCVILAVVLALPIPLGNNLPALGLTLIGLGLIEQDGVAILAGIVAGLIGMVVAGFVVFEIAEGARYLFNWF